MPHFLPNMEWPQHGHHSTGLPRRDKLWGDPEAGDQLHVGGGQQARTGLPDQGIHYRHIYVHVVKCQGHTRHSLSQSQKEVRG